MNLVHILPRYALAAMVLLVVLPYTLMPNWSMRVYISSSGIATMFQIGGLLAFLVLASPLLAKAIQLNRSNVIILGGVYFLLAFLTAPLGIKPQSSAIYTVLMVIFILMSMAVVREADFSKSLALSNRVVMFVVLGIMIVFPYNGSTFGGIQPNIFSKSCLTIFCLSYADPNRFFRISSKVVSILAVIFVTSRSAGIAMIIIFLATYVIRIARRNSTGITYATSLWLCGIALILFGLFYGIYPNAAETFFYNATDKNIQGRFDAWEASIYGIQQSPIIGHGFRSRDGYEHELWEYSRLEAVNAHNGYINSILDMGILGTAIVLFLWVSEMFKNFKALADRNLPDSTRRVLMCFTTVMVASLFTWLSEPLTFNFGNPWSILLVLAIFTSSEIRIRGQKLKLSASHF
ncbi:lipid A core-O-antigen ligase-like enyme [Actibacterium atlanticum]|uniref:Lipid A core-O-antigen ligase-like enyme n=1 Tax=Actibacterium atlanticum TaxID=1461693 RepID=A0A058ZL31_9RHOB|nr:O-antigen ligase family protein [Actibacterium atlanticum]KCV82319.1 lipid A core-O-antigen ligase-like enyme [Actibacterium atlanticum]